MRVLAFGLGKSGTTVLWSRLARSLPDHATEFERHENGSPDLVRKEVAREEYGWEPQQVETFDKRVWIVRDPRGQLVSFLMYSLAFHSSVPQEVILPLLRRKESDPKSVPMVQLWSMVAGEWGKGATLTFDLVKNHRKWGSQFFTFRYEDLIAERVADLECYLGFPLRWAEVPQGLSRVARMKTVDRWRDWFTHEDVLYFRPHLQECMEYFGYSSWFLHGDPHVDPLGCSEYFLRVRGEREC